MHVYICAYIFRHKHTIIGGILRFLEEADQSTDTANMRVSRDSETVSDGTKTSIETVSDGTKTSIDVSSDTLDGNSRERSGYRRSVSATRRDKVSIAQSSAIDQHRTDRNEPVGLASQVYDIYITIIMSLWASRRRYMIYI